MKLGMLNSDKLYKEFLADLKTKISTARYTAARAVNTELIILYWDIGNSILSRHERIFDWRLGKLPVFGGLPVKMQNRTFFKI